MNIGYPIIDKSEIQTEYTDYSVSIADKVIFTGKAWSNPNTKQINVKLNDILKKQLNSGDLPRQITELTDYKVVFTTSTGFTGTVYNNQEYTGIKRNTISAPIGNKYDSRQYLLYSFTNAKTVHPTLNGEDINKNNYESFVFSEELSGDIIFADAFGEFKYYNDCGDYAIYYLNTFGGWDCLLVKATKSESKTNYDYTNETDIRYLTEYKNEYKVYSDYLINRENIPHLLNSTKVYLQNLNNRKIVPVLITDTNYDFKNRFSRLEITLQDANTYSRW